MAISAGLGALLGAGVSAAGNIGGAFTSAKRNYKYGEKAAENAYQRQLDFWNRINEYNLPQNEVQRLKDAGLSVGNFYSGGATGTAASAASAPENKTPGTMGGFDLPDFSRPTQFALQEKALNSQIKLNESQANKNNAEAGLVPTRDEYLQSQIEVNTLLGENTRAKTTGQELSNRLAEETFQYNVYEAEQNFEINEQLLLHYIESLTRSRIDTRIAVGTESTRLRSIEEDLKLKASGVALNYAQLRALEAGVELTESQVDQIRLAIEDYIVYGRTERRYDVAGAKLDLERHQRDIDWYNADKVLGYVKAIGATAVGIVGVSKFAGRKSGQPSKPQSPPKPLKRKK